MTKTIRDQVAGSDTTNVESSQQGRGREEQRDPVVPKLRGKSKDRTASFELRLTQVEEVMGAVDAHMENLDQRVEGLEADVAETHEEVREALTKLGESNREDLQALRDEFMAEVARLRDVHQREINSLLMQLEEARGDLALCKKAVDIPKPKSFAGTRNAREVDNFLWGLEQYFDAVGIIEEGAKIKSAALYLTDTAMLWWRRRQEDVKRGTCSIATFDDFKGELKRQFCPENAEEEAHGRLRRLKHLGSIRDYVKDFTNLVLEIPNMSDKDSLFFFMDGLQTWAKIELRRRGVQDLAAAIAIAESLIDYSSKKEPSKPKEKKGGPNKGGGEHWRGNRKEENRNQGQSPWKPKDEGKQKDNFDRSIPKRGCFLCGELHWTRDCPKTKALNALTADVKGHESIGNKEGAQVGSLQLLNVIQSTPKTQAKGLQFVDATINGKETKALLDTGASHNFISAEEANRLGLQIVGGTGSVKAVNSMAKPIQGIARGVKTTLGARVCYLNLSVVPMDDFKVVLGMEFLDQVKAFPIPFANTMCILDEGKTCVVPTIRSTKPDPQALSAMQFEKGLKRDEESYLAILKEHDDEELPPQLTIPREIEGVLREFKDVMPDELPKKLPPRREVDHQIELEPGAKPPAMSPYRMALPELAELKNQLKGLIDAGFIWPSKAPFGAPVLFKKKKDGSLRMSDLFDQLGHARYFTKLDLRSGYYQVRIAEGDEPKTTCITRSGSYEFLVMPFGLTNAPATFCTLMNKLFYPYLDQFVVVYLDDIVIYSQTLEEHKEHLRKVFQVLKDNKLYVKKEKCSFAQEEVLFLGHKIKGGKLMMEDTKVQAIQRWEPSTKVHELRSFLGLVNYYRRFIKGYSARAAPLTDLLKKNRPWAWSEDCQRAFEDLKKAICNDPVLSLPDYSKPFEVHTDASDFAIGGVLMQDGHPIAYESRKLNETERRYTVQEKEMTAIIHCLRVWRHYLLGSRFVIMTDNIATSYFQTQKKLSPKQARWQDFLAEFDYSLEYKPGKANVVADALSRKVELASISRVDSPLLKRIKEGLQQDSLAKNLIALVMEGKTRRFWLEEGMLYTKGNRLFVPKWGNLRRELIKECHDSKWAGHPGMKRTLALLKTTYYWPQMQDEVESYVRTCLICQQDKVEQNAPSGLLDPLPIPKRPWESVSMDFITSLPKSEGFGNIVVVVDRFSKYATFIPAPTDCTAEVTARLFLKNVVKLWGVPSNIVSDRDPRFTGRFWTELFKLLGSDLNFSTSFHPQSDGQTERTTHSWSYT
ncbi:hypothetical protein M9H77_06694 [Catharanthus roseus]|uniref:Uncharacterized protein n=1 Tax=Catharanthus roseus TaxID=4058 RepID=A0ACC0BT06_CATRO|nr:hypothetical protein M9H77_06694 [Catharanthus roseus]